MLDGGVWEGKAGWRRLLLVINLLLGELLIRVDGLVAFREHVGGGLLLLLLHVEVVGVGWGLHWDCLVMAQHLVLILWRLASHKMDFVGLGIKVATGRAVEAGSILGPDLMVLSLLNYLLHVLTGALQLVKLLRELLVEGLQLDKFLGRFHRLDTCEQVVRHIVRGLKNVVLLHVDLVHARVLNWLD